MLRSVWEDIALKKANVHEILSSYQVEAPSQPSSRFQPEMELPHFRAILLCLIVAQAAWILVEAKGGRGSGGGRGSSGGTPSRSSSSSSWSIRSGWSRPGSGTSSNSYWIGRSRNPGRGWFRSGEHSTSRSGSGASSKLPFSGFRSRPTGTVPEFHAVKASTSGLNAHRTSATAGYGWNVPQTQPGSPGRSSWSSGVGCHAGSGRPYGGGGAYGSSGGYVGSGGYSGGYAGSGRNLMLQGSSGARAQDAALGFVAGTTLARLPMRHRYRGRNWSRESGEGTEPHKVVTLAWSEAGTCTALVENKNQTIGAIQSMAAVPVRLYDRPEYGGTSTTVYLNANECLNLHGVDRFWNDRASSIRTEGISTCVMIWQHANCRGKFACIKNESKGANRLSEIHMNDDLTSLQLC